MPDSLKNETLENFRKGNVNILVATSVGSEGIDVPDCNFIITYNYTGNEASVIQMSGKIPDKLHCVIKFYQKFESLKWLKLITINQLKFSRCEISSLILLCCQVVLAEQILQLHTFRTKRSKNAKKLVYRRRC
jgi:hypothetical protein